MFVQKYVRESDREIQRGGEKETAEKKELNNIPSGCACACVYVRVSKWAECVCHHVMRGFRDTAEVSQTTRGGGSDNSMMS